MLVFVGVRKLTPTYRADEIEHLQRAKANLSSSLLDEENEELQNQGINELERAIQLKLNIGDIDGVATNYCQLGNYFRKKKRYGRAIAYCRKDLYFSKLVGNKRDIASTLGNLATLYGELKQFSEGRNLLGQVKTIAEELEDDDLLDLTKHQLNFLNEDAKKAGLNKIQIGKQAKCECGSGLLYVDCCGRADFEPVDYPFVFGGISEDLKKINNESINAGKDISPLDFILRIPSESSIRKAWSSMEMHDGWMTIKELPDMASIHLVSAKTMAKNAIDDNDISSALAAVILSVCYLEAFINQVSYFIYEYKNDSEVAKMNIPQDLLDNMQDYQRKTKLEFKWSSVSECLTRQGWLESLPKWKEVKDLIYIRNEFVHFKSNEYEQVVPPPKQKDVIYSKVPNSITIKDGPHSWPFKLLTADLAEWAVNISESLVLDLKTEYRNQRLAK